MGSTPSSSSPRNLGLDYLRALAIILVISNHALYGFLIGTGQVKFEGFIASLSAATVVSIEWLFVLSGFLIGAMMIRSFESGKAWRSSTTDFWLRRWFRTFPNYYLFVAINFLLIYFGMAQGAVEVKHLVFSQNLAWLESVPHFFGEAWSLALDEWFYLLMPVLIGLSSLKVKDQRLKFILAAGVLISIPMLLRMLHTVPTEFFQWDAEIRRITIYHLDATGWGVLAACVSKWHPRWWSSKQALKARWGFLILFTGCMGVVGLLHPAWMNTMTYFLTNSFSITLMAGGTFLVLPWLTSLSFNSRVLNGAVKKISLYSYSIYLVHFPLIFLVNFYIALDKNTSIMVVSFVILAWILAVFIVSALLYHGFEKPVADLRDGFTRRVDASPF